eukprot:CAMPEP_0117448062 /NCGR_PEP_ID=MMETSP0759-20121206/7200_1 /TAXON_ID=63605 /ORGANISM="Percolomonas cosmopolitus, Strain WS" /LENGTH=197 /DNA_ID=CAMNT_0005240423 /DNA_START=205 /DNA_END=798 /DNA_ORIENTATION=+
MLQEQSVAISRLEGEVRWMSECLREVMRERSGYVGRMRERHRGGDASEERRDEVESDMTFDEMDRRAEDALKSVGVRADSGITRIQRATDQSENDIIQIALRENEREKQHFEREGTHYARGSSLGRQGNALNQQLVTMRANQQMQERRKGVGTNQHAAQDMDAFEYRLRSPKEQSPEWCNRSVPSWLHHRLQEDRGR